MVLQTDHGPDYAQFPGRLLRLSRPGLVYRPPAAASPRLPVAPGSTAENNQHYNNTNFFTRNARHVVYNALFTVRGRVQRSGRSNSKMAGTGPPGHGIYLPPTDISASRKPSSPQRAGSTNNFFPSWLTQLKDPPMNDSVSPRGTEPARE